MVEEELADRSLGTYWRVLREHRTFRFLFIGEVISFLGNWLNYVATLTLLEGLTGGSSALLLSLLIVIRFLPAFLLFPVTGVVCDRYNRVKVLVYSCLISAVSVGALTLIHRRQDLWGLYVIVFVQFAMTAFYNPARTALTPCIVPRCHLSAASTLDSFVKSLLIPVGSFLGSLAVSRLGTTACFLMDASTYLAAAACPAPFLNTDLSFEEKASADSTEPITAWDVAALVAMKGCGTLVYGGVEVLAVKYSELDAMQVLGDAATTLGLIFAAVGVGAVVGPLMFNQFTVNRVPHLLRSAAQGLLVVVCGYLLLLPAQDIYTLLLATSVRACGSTTFFIYTTVLLQIRVPNEFLGRMLALEMAFNMVTGAVAVTLVGVEFDVLHMTLREVVAVLLATSVAAAVGWGAFAWRVWARHTSEQGVLTQYAVDVPRDAGEEIGLQLQPVHLLVKAGDMLAARSTQCAAVQDEQNAVLIVSIATDTEVELGM